MKLQEVAFIIAKTWNFARKGELASQISYSLDRFENVTITGNTTLLYLPIGVHNVVVYAIDKAGNTGSSEIINFTVNDPSSNPIILIPIIILILVGILAYFKKYRKQIK